MVLLLSLGLVTPQAVRRALRTTFETRETHVLPAQLPEPPQAWTDPYEALAKELKLRAVTLQEAYAYVGRIWQEWRLGEA